MLHIRFNRQGLVTIFSSAGTWSELKLHTETCQISVLTSCFWNTRFNQQDFFSSDRKRISMFLLLYTVAGNLTPDNAACLHCSPSLILSTNASGLRTQHILILSPSLVCDLQTCGEICFTELFSNIIVHRFVFSASNARMAASAFFFFLKPQKNKKLERGKLIHRN